MPSTASNKLSERAVPKAEFAVLAALALGLWSMAITARSLWLDELHCLDHVQASTWADFFRAVQSDNHPPLAFLLSRISVELFGNSEWGLRLPNLLIGLWTLLATERFARHLPADGSRRGTVWLVALSSFSIVIFSEARMYGLLLLGVVGTLGAILDVLRTGRGLPRVVFFMCIALHAHYYACFYFAMIALSLLVLAAVDRSQRGGVWKLVGGALMAGLLFLPWALWGLRAQLAHGLPAGANYTSPIEFVQSLGHLLYFNSSLGGEWVRLYVALPGFAAAGCLGALGFWRTIVRGDRLDLRCLLVAVGLGVPVFCFLAAHYFERLSYNWRYIAGSLLPVAVWVTAGMKAGPNGRAGIFSSAGKLLGGFVFATVTIVTVVNARSPGQEDFRGATALILEQAREGDAVMTMSIWYTRADAKLNGWSYYAPRVIEDVGTFMPEEFRPGRMERAAQSARVWVMVRGWYPPWVLDHMRANFESEEVFNICPMIDVHLFDQKK